MAAPTIDPIYGYVTLTDNFRKWIQKMWMKQGYKHLAGGWRAFPAHDRENPNKGIITRGYPDVEDAHYYHFDDPEKRDKNNEINRLPLPIKSTRDKEWFREQNARLRPKYGFDMYMVLDSRKKFVTEYVPEQAPTQSDDFITSDAVQVPAERKAHVAHEAGGISAEVLAQAMLIVEEKKAKDAKTEAKPKPKIKKSRTETRLQTV